MVVRAVLPVVLRAALPVVLRAVPVVECAEEALAAALRAALPVVRAVLVGREGEAGADSVLRVECRAA